MSELALLRSPCGALVALLAALMTFLLAAVPAYAQEVSCEQVAYNERVIIKCESAPSDTGGPTSGTSSTAPDADSNDASDRADAGGTGDGVADDSTNDNDTSNVDDARAGLGEAGARTAGPVDRGDRGGRRGVDDRGSHQGVADAALDDDQNVASDLDATDSELSTTADANDDDRSPRDQSGDQLDPLDTGDLDETAAGAGAANAAPQAPNDSDNLAVWLGSIAVALFALIGGLFLQARNREQASA